MLRRSEPIFVKVLAKKASDKNSSMVKIAKRIGTRKTQKPGFHY